eukprot:scaffold85458_cov48-Phaeocystis_antarctica.AAC.2
MVPVPLDGPVTVGLPRKVGHRPQPLRTATRSPAKGASMLEFRDSTVFSPRTRASANGSSRLSAGSRSVWSRSISEGEAAEVVEAMAMASGGLATAVTEGAAGAGAATRVAAVAGAAGVGGGRTVGGDAAAA